MNDDNHESNTKLEHKFNNFKILDSLDINQIVKLFETESLQIKALILTFLPSHRAKMVLNKIPTKNKKKILNRISKIKVINLDVVSKIEEVIEDDIKNRVRKLLTVNGEELSKGLKDDIDEAKVGRVTETEKKYQIDSLSMFDTLVDTKNILGYNLENKNVKEREYLYFDTEDLYLYHNNITYSVRDRDKDYFFTLKIPKKNDILERDEYNASVNKDENIFDIDIHKNNFQLIPVRMINDIIKNKKLIISTKFKVVTIRYIINLDKDHSIEISFDKIIAKNPNKLETIELYELEIENKTSEDFVFLNFCENFRLNTGLKPLTQSKYQRIMKEQHNPT